jgi:Ser/Thr protein kinase RdoA (MazF antagonist)
VTWQDRLQEVKGLAARLSPAATGIFDAVSPFLERIEAFASRFDPAPPGPSHRSFRPAQVMVHEGAVGFIDFDGFCRAEAALDLALFCASLRDVGLRAAASPDDRAAGRTIALLDAMCEEFLAAYSDRMPLDRRRVAVWEGLDVLANVLNCWAKLKFDRLPKRMLLLAHFLSRDPLG